MARLYTSKCGICSALDRERTSKNVALVAFSKGYTNSNVFPVCVMCQRIRHGLNKSQVVALAANTVIHSSLLDRLGGSAKQYRAMLRKNKVGHMSLPSVRSHSTNYNTYRCSASKRCQEAGDSRCPSSTFTLTRRQFDDLRKLACFYCGLEDARGVDRLYPTMGYTTGNSVPCCKTCNYAKNDLHPGVYIGHLVRILRGNPIF